MIFDLNTKAKDVFFKNSNNGLNANNVQDAINETYDVSKITDTATGEHITLTNSADAPVRSLKIDGKTEQEEEPTPDNPKEIICVGKSGNVEVTFTGKNLLENTATNQTTDGYTFTVNRDKSVTVSGNGSRIGLSIQDYFSENGRFVLSGVPNIEGVHLEIWNATKQERMLELNNGEAEFENVDGDRLVFTLYVNGDVNTTVYPMVRKVEIKDGTYESHKAQTVPIPVTSPLFKNDSATLKNGKLELNRKFKIVDFPVITSLSTYTDGRKYVIFSQEDMADYGTFKCTHMKEIQPSDNVTYGFMVNQYNSVFMFSADDTIETANTKISGAKVLYFLKEPTTEIIETDIDLSTYCNVTNITNSDNANMEVEYFVNSANGNVSLDLKKEIDELDNKKANKTDISRLDREKANATEISRLDREKANISLLKDYVVVEQVQHHEVEPISPNEQRTIEVKVSKNGYIPVMAMNNNDSIKNIVCSGCRIVENESGTKSVKFTLINLHTEAADGYSTIDVLYVKDIQ